MAYTKNYSEFLSLLNSSLRAIFEKFELPCNSFFSEERFNSDIKKKINISVKTSIKNIEYLSDKLCCNVQGKNLDFKHENYVIRFIISSKKSTISSNSLGKQLADAGELATVLSLTRNIKTPKDTEQQIFINNTDLFERWHFTFKETKKAIYKITKRHIENYEILHDATDKSQFKEVIDNFCKNMNIKKDSWNPADIFLIDKNEKENIIIELQNLIHDIDNFNKTIYKLYRQDLLYPISLKQLSENKKEATIEFSNIPGEIKIPNYNIKIEKINCDLSDNGKEIGLFQFRNICTDKVINLQVRGFPHSYGIAQTEITSDGTETGGRLGKISTKIIDKILDEYDYKRITSINYFGKAPNYFENFTEEKIKFYFDMYCFIIKNEEISVKNKLSYENFYDLVQNSKKDFELAKTMCQKIQGLVIINFFINNKNSISNIMNNMLNGAKKISDKNGFFIKIY